MVEQQDFTTVLIVSATLIREAYTGLLDDTAYKPSLQAQSIDDFEKLSIQQSNQLLFIITSDAIGHDVEGNTFAKIQELKKHYPESRVLILSDEFTIAEVFEALNAGANGYLLSSLTKDALVKSLDLLVLGHTVLAAEFSATVHSHSEQPGWPGSGRYDDIQSESMLSQSKRSELLAKGVRLSNRETTILTRLLEGEANKAIARHIGVTEATVKTHVKTILRKVGAKNRTQAALWAYENMQRHSGLTPETPVAANGHADPAHKAGSVSA